MRAVQTPEHLKTEAGEESFNPDGLAQRSIKLLKDTFPDVEVRMPVSCMHPHVRELQRLDCNALLQAPLIRTLNASMLDNCTVLLTLVRSGPSILPSPCHPRNIAQYVHVTELYHYQLTK